MPEIQDWIQKHIVSRISRGTEWREKLSEHATTAKITVMFGFLAKGFRPVSISVINPCGHLNDEAGKEIGSLPSPKL